MTREALTPPGRRFTIISALGIVEILAWGSSYYLSAIIAQHISSEMGWPTAWAVGGMAVGSLTAGLISPRIGTLITVHGGRRTMAGGCLVLASGLALLGLSVNLASFLLAWMVIGFGMSASLYNAAFSTLGRIFGDGARPAISTLTLFGGFASTVCWPFSTLLLETYGWRATCFSYALIHTLLSVPLILLALPKESPPPSVPRRDTITAAIPPSPAPRHRLTFPILAIVLVGGEITSSILSVHLITMLTERGHSLAVAVSIGMVLGPAQVGARILEMTLGARIHPIWTLIVAACLTATGLFLLCVDFSIPGAALLCYGAGNGIWSIAKGTLPLALFGPDQYPVMMGRLARPALLAQAAAPTLGAVVLANAGVTSALAMMVCIAVTGLSLALVLKRISVP